MSISLDSPVVITLSWTKFQNIAVFKSLLIQYDDDGVMYFVFALDGPISYSCNIWHGVVPDGVIAGGYSQAQNDVDKAIFENNYKPVTNAPVASIMKPYYLFNNGTISASGSQVITGFDSTEVVLIINVLNSPTGTIPTLQFAIQEVDPINQLTVVGTSVSSIIISTITATTVQITNSISNTMRVSWTLNGSSSPIFTGVNVAIIQKIGGGTVTAALSPSNNVIFPDTVSLGLISGGLSVVAIGKIVGAPTTFAALINTAYNEPAAVAQRSMSSSSANDTAAGTGVRMVKITYYDTSCNGPFTETVIMNGTTAVNTVNTNIRFIERLESVTVGTSGGPAGIVTLFNSTAGGGGILATYGGSSGGQIDNISLFAHHYVRPSKTAYIKWWNTRTDQGVSTPSTDVIIQKLMARDPTNALSPFKQITTENTTISTGATTFELIFEVPIIVPGPARIVAYGLTRGGISTNISSSFGLVEL